MPLCAVCDSIPLRKILRGDNLSQDTIAWYQDTVRQREDDKARAPFLLWHNTFQQLLQSAFKCELCRALSQTYRKSWKHKHDENDGKIWIRLPISGGHPEFRIYLGVDQPESEIDGCFEFFPKPDSPVAGYFTQYILHEDPSNSDVLEKMYLRVQSCNDMHQNLACSQIREHQVSLPTRLLDLQLLPNRNTILTHKGDWRLLFKLKSCKLIQNAAGERGQYVALSYCWGNHLAYTTTKDNIERHKRMIPFSDLPRTLQDAMFLVRYLGLRYIWIDCLCIVQDDKADWEREAARMADVYSKSYLSIAATRASHCDEGFLHPRKVRDREPIRFEDDEGTFELYFIKERHSHFKDRKLLTLSLSFGGLLNNKEPLQRRGWTFQERLLAPRILHFASDQTLWECAQMCENEEGSFRDPIGDSSLDKIAEFLIRDVFADSNAVGTNPWANMINSYTSCTLKYPSDFFPALSGVLVALQKLTGGFCYAGLWENHFLEGLLWVIEDPERSWRTSPGGLIPPKKPQKLSFWRAPSWSFASIEGTASYESQFYPHGRRPEYIARLEECSVTPVGHNPLGELKAGLARVNGPVTSIKHIEPALPAMAAPTSTYPRACIIQLRDQSISEAGVVFDFEEYDRCDVLMLTPHAGVAIISVDGCENHYVRVGIVRVKGQMKADGRINRESNLTVADYPESRTIVLL